MTMHHTRCAVTALLLTACLAWAPPAAAQFFAPPSDVPIDEDYYVEVLGGMWSPTPSITIASDAFGIAGTNIDFARDLGLASERFGELRLRLRPGRKHRFRIDYLPMSYTSQTVVDRRLVFRGIAYDAGLPVSSTMTWRTWRLGYEYDVIHRRRGYFGLILEAKYTELEAALDTGSGREFTRARGPIPAIGGVLRIYPLPVLGVTAEVSGFRLPSDVVRNHSGRYVDLDIYTTLNFTQQIGAQIGYRSLDLNVVTHEDLADLRLEGMYMGGLFRF